jgi:hypothetical protein
MASYASFIAMCGFEYNGPEARIGFAPRLTPGNFRAAFTSAEGWGSFSQKFETKKTTASLDLSWGKLRVQTMTLALPDSRPSNLLAVTINGRPVAASRLRQDGRLSVMLSEPAEICAFLSRAFQDRQ